jgi:hypothetical protein
MKEILKILGNYKLLGSFFWFTIFITILTEFSFLIFPQISREMM